MHTHRAHAEIEKEGGREREREPGDHEDPLHLLTFLPRGLEVKELRDLQDSANRQVCTHASFVVLTRQVCTHSVRPGDRAVKLVNRQVCSR